MTVRIYRWSDTSAPQLDGTSGSLVTLLDAVLVGSGGIAYGSTSSSGWTTAFTGTNLRAYRQAAVVSGTNFQYYLKVRDDAPSSSTDARIRGFETMTAVSATNDGTDGTNLFPTAAQLANSLFVRKSAVTTAAIYRPWVIAADSRTFYMFVGTGDTAALWFVYGFGDIYSLKTNDIGRCFIYARGTEAVATASVDNFDILDALGTNRANHYLARDTVNNVGAIAFGKIGDISLGHASGGVNVGTLPVSNIADNKIYVVPLRVIQTTGGNQIRGRMRGMWATVHPLASFADQETFSGSGDLNGKSFMVFKSTGNSGLYILETSDTWDTN